MRKASDIIEALGGSAELARETGFPLTTIESWKPANFIPEWRQPRILGVAKDKGIALKASDFPPKSARVSRQPARAAA